MARGHVSAIWNPGDPHQSPQTTIFTPETIPFSLAAFQEGNTLNTAKYTFSCLNPPHPWNRAIYRPSGTLGTLIEATKQQCLPLKRAHLT